MCPKHPRGAGRHIGGACTQCPLGRYKGDTNNAPCTPCAHGEYSGVLGAIACVPCLQHSQSFPAEGGTKCICSAGYFQEDVALERPTCQPCAANTYQHLTGTTACSSCPAHASSPPASPAIYACICGAGMFDTGTGECQACCFEQGHVGPCEVAYGFERRVLKDDEVSHICAAANSGVNTRAVSRNKGTRAHAAAGMGAACACRGRDTTLDGR